MMMRKQLERLIDFGIKTWAENGSTETGQDAAALVKLLRSIRDSQTTADGKIALCGEYVWHVNRGETESKREMVDLPETTGGRNIRHTYSSEAALKRAMKKAKAK
jgi:hypothetical protein